MKTALQVLTLVALLPVAGNSASKVDEELRAKLAASQARIQAQLDALKLETAKTQQQLSAVNKASTKGSSNVVGAVNQLGTDTKKANVSNADQIVAATQDASDRAISAQRDSADQLLKVIREQNYGHYSEFGVAIITLLTLMFTAYLNSHKLNVQGSQLKQIHTLVNSNVTEIMERELALLKSNLLLLEKASLSSVTPAETVIISGVRIQIANLEASLDMRQKQTNLAAAQLQYDTGNA